MVDAFSLKFQRVNRENALACIPSKGKPEKKAVFSPYYGDEAPHTMTEPKK